MSTIQQSHSESANLKSGDIEIRQLAGRIGAHIENVRLSADLPAGVVASIEAALAKHKVIFFRGQGHLDDAAQERFAARLGDVVAHPTNPARPGTAILELDSTGGGGRADHWHTDVTFMDVYPKISILRGVVIPPYGGDTVWANTVAAYEGLPPALKTLAENLWAVHSNLFDYAAVKPQATADAARRYEEVFTSTVYETEHPVVRVLRSGERSLVLGYFVRRFAGYSQSDSHHLFELLQSHVTRLDNTVRWRWQEGDVAIWDNTSTQHYAINDYGDHKRVVRRSTVQGELPVSVDGRTSVAKRKTVKPPVQPRPRESAAA
jgi:alpha-ketoglutarate-dependent sulfate ester dioxygenase